MAEPADKHGVKEFERLFIARTMCGKFSACDSAGHAGEIGEYLSGND